SGSDGRSVVPDQDSRNCYPVATAPGTDSITPTKVGILTPVSPGRETVSSFIRQIRLLLLGMWLGAAIFFGAAVAPALFGVLRNAGLANANELAGSMVTRLLQFINRGGFEIALFLFITSFFVHRHRRPFAQVAEVIS